MGKIVAWERLKPGDVVWEEWLYGTRTMKAKVIRRGDANHLFFRFTPEANEPFHAMVRPSREYRYWDSEPTMEERQETGWDT